MNTRNNGLLLDRLLEPVSASLNEEAARKLVKIKADRKTQARVAELAEKCNEGELTPAERHEYEMYVMANHLVSIFKANARILLARKGQSA
jgi:hypothetical protein